MAMTAYAEKLGVWVYPHVTHEETPEARDARLLAHSPGYMIGEALREWAYGPDHLGRFFARVQSATEQLAWVRRYRIDEAPRFGLRIAVQAHESYEPRRAIAYTVDYHAIHDAQPFAADFIRDFFQAQWDKHWRELNAVPPKRGGA